MVDPKLIKPFVQRQFALCRGVLSLNVDDIERAHELRLVVKRLRAAYALIENASLDRVFGRELRAVSRQLGEVRDHDIVMSWLARHGKSLPRKLVEKIAGADATFAFDARRPAVVRSAARKLLALENRFVKAAGAVRAADETRGRLLAEHASARKVFKKLREGNGRARDYHELRKRAKELLYQVEAASDLEDGSTRRYWTKLKTVSTVLGDAHDLSVVRVYLKGAKGGAARDTRKKLKARREELHLKAIERGSRCFTKVPPMGLAL